MSHESRASRQSKEQARSDRPHRTHDLVVGVDGTAASANALRYALKEASGGAGKVEVFHVIPDYAPMAYPIPFDELMDAGRAALESTLHQVGQAGHGTSGAALSTHLERGSVVRTLTTAAQGAAAVVVGCDRRSVATRLLTGNVSTGLAARAAVPVVSVPETWSPDRATGVVLAAVKHPAHSEGLLAEAFALAHRRGSRLVALHAWRFPSAYDDVIVSDPQTLGEWAARARQELEDLVEPWRHTYPDVDVELRAVHDFPAHALVEASGDADELVIVRRAHGFPAAAHLGSTARTVLLHAHCPVRVVPAVHVPMLPDLELEAAGTPLTRATT